MVNNRKRRVDEEEEQVLEEKAPKSVKKRKSGEGVPNAAALDAAEQRRRAIEWAQQVLQPVRKPAGRRQSTGSLPALPKMEDEPERKAPATAKKSKKNAEIKEESPAPSPHPPKVARRGRSLATLAEDVKQVTAPKATPARGKSAKKAASPVASPTPLPEPVQPTLPSNSTPSRVSTPAATKADVQAEDPKNEVAVVDAPPSSLVGHLAQGSVLCAAIALSFTFDHRVGGVALGVALLASLLRRCMSSD